MLALSILFPRLTAQSQWLSPWLQRIPIFLTTDSPQYDLEVKITIPTDQLINSGSMQPDCSDMRFTTSDGITLLPYWIESGCGTPSTTIWIRIDTLKGFGQLDTIYMYMNNPGAPPASSPYQAFHLWEPFDTLSSIWQVLEPALVQISGGWLILTGDGYPLWEKVKTNSRIPVKGFIIESYEVLNAGSNTYHWMYIGSYPTSFTSDANLCNGGICGGDNIGWGTGCGWGDFQIYIGDSGQHFCNGNPITSGLHYIKQFKFGPADTTFLTVFDTAWAPLASVYTTAWTILDSAYLMYLCAYNGTCEVNWLRIRRLPSAPVTLSGMGTTEFACILYPPPDTQITVYPGGLQITNPDTSSIYAWYDCLTDTLVDTGIVFNPPYSGWFRLVTADKTVFPRCAVHTSCYPVCVDVITPQLISVDSTLLALAPIPQNEQTTYIWQDCETGIILDTTQWNWWQPPYVGSFRVIIYAKNNACVDTSACVSIRKDTISGVADLNNTSIQLLYSNGSLMILSKNHVHRITLNNLTGKILITKTITNPKYVHLNINQLPSGLYILKIETADKIVTQPLLVR